MCANKYWKGDGFVNQKLQTRTGPANPFPRSHSSNAVPTTATSLLPKGQIMPGQNVAKTTDDLPPAIIPGDEDSNSSTADEWGNEFDDMLCVLSTQDAEKAEGLQRHGVQSPLRQRHPSPPTSTNGSKFPRMNSDEEIQSTNIHARRAKLAELETGSGTLTNNDVLGLSKEEMKKATDKITSLETDNTNFKSEINKLRGEVSNLRRVNDKLNKEQQADVQARLRLRKENTKELEEAKAKVIKIQNEMEILRADIMKYKWNSSAGGMKKKSMDISLISTSNSSDMDISSVIHTPPQLSQTRQASTSRKSTPVELTVTEKPQASPQKVHCHVQTEESLLTISSKSSSLPPLTVTDPNPSQPRIRALSPIPSSVETREKIFQKLDQIVELQYQLILPTLGQVVKTAPTEIMRRLVRNVELKSAFPGVVDTMFQWGMDQERKNARATAGFKEPRPPTLPSRFTSGTEYYVIKNGISTSFKYGGIWGALSEVRGWLEKILKSLQGSNRFRLYEYNTLTNFWRLLFWGNEFWRGLLSEEENEATVLQNKSRWVKELQGWTGLVLKSDWRDYFALDLEIEVRKLTLGILENIVTSGYFEQENHRYEILYRILKDVLIHDAFRNISNIQHVLRIVNWSISDLTIFKHLCYKTNETNTCLARMIGENVLKVCREAEPIPIDSVSVARLFLDYANLLETLMSEKPPSYHQSQYARQSITDVDSPPPVQLQNSEEMLADSSFSEDLMAASQFACPIKYNNAHPMDIDLDEEEEPLENLACCWLDPAKYEDPFGRLKLCQCRKVLMGTAIHLLKIIFNFWSQKYLDYERQMENQDVAEQEELAVLEFIASASPQNFETHPIVESESFRLKQHGDRDRLEYLRKKLEAKKKLILIGQGLTYPEWNGDDCIREKKKLPVTSKHDPEADAFLPPCVMEYKRGVDIFDQALSKGVILMNFIHNKVDNLAAMLGTDAYKTYMMLKALLRLHMDRIHFTRIERDLLTAMTPECEEDHLGAALTHAGHEEPQNFKPASITNPSVDYPIPLTPLDNNAQEEWGELAIQSEKDMTDLWDVFGKATGEKSELLEMDERGYEDVNFIKESGPYTYRPIRQKLERKSK